MSRTPDVYRFGDAEVDFARCELRRSGEVVPITPVEFKLLSAFVRSRGRVLSREQLLDQVWADVNVRRSRRRHPRRQPAQEDRARFGRAAVPGECARNGLPVRWLIPLALLTKP